MIERLLPILLLILWTIAGVLPHVRYKIERNTAWQRFERNKNTIPASAVQTMQFPDYASVQWEKPGREFRVNGKLYDVIRIRNIDSAVLIQCVPDEKEDAVVAVYQHSLKHDKQDKQQQKVWKFDFYCTAVPRIFLQGPDPKGQPLCRQPIFNAVFCGIESPPPKI